MPFLILVAASVLLVAALLLVPWWRRRGRDRLRRQPFPAGWRRVLRRRAPIVQRLPADLQLQLKQHIQVLLAETPMIGCAGLVLDDEIRLTIAAHACLLLLNRPDAGYPGLRQILVYPGPFVVERTHVDASGLVQDTRQALAGESWAQGQVILSWQDVARDAADPDAGRNVVIHECAHQLDQETGSANGAPALGRGQDGARWSEVLAAEYARLQQAAREGRSGVLDGYGASSPGEFFAVATEAFFLRPHAMREEHAALFAELRGYYRVDPLLWTPAPSGRPAPSSA